MFLMYLCTNPLMRRWRAGWPLTPETGFFILGKFLDAIAVDFPIVPEEFILYKDFDDLIGKSNFAILKVEY